MMFNTQFNSCFATKIYIFKDWDLGTGDFAVIELEEPLGESTGWISIGFNKTDSILLDGIFYKFTYPSMTILRIDSNEYNGDTLYYNYGGVDIVNSTSIKINNTSGIPGESGSSLIKITNGLEYTSYGVLSLSNNLNHSKIRNWQFYALENIIANDLISTTLPENIDQRWKLYPNPVSNTLYIENIEGSVITELVLVDNIGRIVQIIDTLKLSDGVDVSDLPNGLYFLKATIDQSISTMKIIKK